MAAKAETQETNAYEISRYLGFPRSAYYMEYKYEPIDTPDIRLDILHRQKENVEARRQMMANIAEFDSKLTEMEESGEAFSESFEIVLRNLARKIALEAPGANIGFLKKLEEPGMLFSHLKETGDSVEAFFNKIQKYTKGKDEILSERQIKLLKFVALTHDLGKLMGSMNAQIDPDHEVFYRIIIGKHLEGKYFEGTLLTAEDVEFITQVAGFHEDIFREEDFANQATALQKTEIITPEIAVARARAIFHFIDIFGNAVRIENDKLEIVDKKAFQIRFIDLFRRHIKLPIVEDSGIDWAFGKVMRPEWGEHGVAGLTWTFGILEDEWGIKLDQGLIDSVKNGILYILNEANSAISGVLNGKSGYKLKVAEDMYLPVTKEILNTEEFKKIKGTLENNQYRVINAIRNITQEYSQ